MSDNTVLAFDQDGDRLLIAAADVQAGDEVCFRASFANYVVDAVEGVSVRDRPGVRHQHGNYTASSCYEDGELLWVRTPRKRVLGHLGRQSPGVPR